MIKFLCSCWALLIALISFAQNQTADSLLKAIQGMRDDSLKVDALIQLSRNYYNDSWDNAIRYANEAKDLAGRIGYKKGEALAFKGIGIAYYVMGQPVNA